MIKALIIDLDNTVYPAKSIGEELFQPIISLMDEYKESLSTEDLDKAKQELTRTPFQKVADKFGFPEEFKKKGVEILKHRKYDKPFDAYPDYPTLAGLNIDKFLVTFGFVTLQNSKIDQLGVRGHFKKIYIVDPEETHETKKEVFQKIMDEFGYKPEELLAIGDDMESEIKAAKALGIPTYLFDAENRYQPGETDYYAKDYQLLKGLLKQ
ncbi:HAD hydrolase-like protein [Mucilaginibacter sp. RS28]|uniref:HAD hydrolase-like protein n=1 Tax=Mucilaginibacter straminoryzae TaxID=2932774 RepID=A0A9X2B7Y5_9SPHI|nr:HAD family hydrolase [Mucilaginibacter straminoryzae]MCJ8209084.1 HAD hydrolase-like protein [Mucilaginibacter straminoryzae]